MQAPFSKTMNIISKDYQTIASYINENDRVLDLGCSMGDLLLYLKREKNISGIGVETDIKKIEKCLSKDIDVYHGDIFEAIELYKKISFDVVIVSQTVQVINKPGDLIYKMFRIAKKGIISFRNYGYFGNRLQFLFKGKKPRNEAFPYTWYETPDIHPVSIGDFEEFCHSNHIRIVKKTYLKGDWEKEIKFFKGFFAGYAIYLLEKK